MENEKQSPTVDTVFGKLATSRKNLCNNWRAPFELSLIEGEDPHQQLMHIRQDDKWNTSKFVNWLKQAHADDDGNVTDKNPV